MGAENIMSEYIDEETVNGYSDDNIQESLSPTCPPLYLAEEGEDGMYNCDQCDKVFSLQNTLKDHKLLEHEGMHPSGRFC